MCLVWAYKARNCQAYFETCQIQLLGNEATANVASTEVDSFH